MLTPWHRSARWARRRGLLAAAVLCIAALGAAPAHADPRTHACGVVNKHAQTFRFRAANLSCRFARRLLTASTNARGRVVGHRAYAYTASDCEGIIWRDRDRDYCQAHEGRLPAKSRIVRYVITHGCVG